MELQGKRVAVLVEDDYQELELWYPVLRMREAGAEVRIIGPRQGSFKSQLGYPAQADMAIDDARPEGFDAVVVPGGYAPDRMRRHSKMVAFVKDTHDQRKIVAAICHPGWMLASAGIITGRRVTSFFAIKDDMINAGADWVDQEVVVDGNIITSRTPDDLPAFSREIVKALTPAKVGV